MCITTFKLSSSLSVLPRVLRNPLFDGGGYEYIAQHLIFFFFFFLSSSSEAAVICAVLSSNLLWKINFRGEQTRTYMVPNLGLCLFIFLGRRGRGGEEGRGRGVYE